MGQLQLTEPSEHKRNEEPCLCAEQYEGMPCSDEEKQNYENDGGG